MRHPLWRSAAVTAALLSVATVPAQAEDASISVKSSVTPARAGPSDKVKLAVEITVPAGWHLWSLDPGPGPLALTIKLPDGAPVAFEGPWHGPAPHEVFDRGFERDLKQYEGGVVTLERLLAVDSAATAGATDIELNIRGQICTDETCLNQRIKSQVALEFIEAATGVAPAALTGSALTMRAAGAAKGTTAAVAPAPAKRTSSKDALEKAKEEGIFSFILLAFLAGLGALATPCVFPAIPMTVSFFSKYSEKSFGHGARLAAFYAVSMMFYFTLAGLLVSALFGVTGIQQFAAHPIFNLVLASVLVVFALSLMGWFKIQTPAWAYSLTNKLENKYGANAIVDESERKSGVLADYVAVGVAAMTGTTVFFTCTVAFVGVVLVAAAEGEWFWPTIGMLAFSAAFVLPFFLLALFPSAANRLRGKSGDWIKAVCVTLGVVELAAAMKFFSNADLVWRTNVLTRDLVLVIWVSLFLLLALFLIGKVDMRAADEPAPDGRISVPRAIFGASMFAFALHLSLALFTGRQLGGWIDGWLPPPVLPGEAAPGATLAGTGAQGAAQPAQGFAWIHDLAKGRKVAKEKGTPIFLNYTGYTCTNCRYMESGVFPRPEIASLLRQTTLIELYTDGMTPDNDANREDQLARFQTAALPFYVVETSDGVVVDTFPSSTNDPEEFRRWLAGALDKARAAPAAPAEPAAKGTQLVLRTTRLTDGTPAAAYVPGKWTLINFWATWCAPCREELEAFLAKMGADLEARGGRFAAVALEEDDTVAEALAFMKKIGVPAESALRLPGELEEGDVDARLEFTGEQLPFTVLISPSGEVVWRHESAIKREQLQAVLTEHTGISQNTADAPATKSAALH